MKTNSKSEDVTIRVPPKNSLTFQNSEEKKELKKLPEKKASIERLPEKKNSIEKLPEKRYFIEKLPEKMDSIEKLPEKKNSIEKLPEKQDSLIPSNFGSKKELEKFPEKVISLLNIQQDDIGGIRTSSVEEDLRIVFLVKRKPNFLQGLYPMKDFNEKLFEKEMPSPVDQSHRQKLIDEFRPSYRIDLKSFDVSQFGSNQPVGPIQISEIESTSSPISNLFKISVDFLKGILPGAKH